MPDIPLFSEGTGSAGLAIVTANNHLGDAFARSLDPDLPERSAHPSGTAPAGFSSGAAWAIAHSTCVARRGPLLLLEARLTAKAGLIEWLHTVHDAVA